MTPTPETQRILNGIARRLLTEELDAKALDPPPVLADPDGLDLGPDEGAFLGERVEIPFADRDAPRRARAALSPGAR